MSESPSMTDFRAGFVAVVGKPNVGKSTLINHFVGRKVSIVSPRPQTTRRRILGIANLPNAQIVFVDTPGIHKPKHKLGEQMVEAALGALPDADLILFVCDVSRPPGEEDRQIADILNREARAPIVLVLNKMDRLPPEKVKPHTEAYWQLVPQHVDWMMTNAVKGHNCDKLLHIILNHLPQAPPFFPPDQMTDQPMQFLRRNSFARRCCSTPIRRCRMGSRSPSNAGKSDQTMCWQSLPPSMWSVSRTRAS
jgi:GTP-binding protein Era